MNTTRSFHTVLFTAIFFAFLVCLVGIATTPAHAQAAPAPVEQSDAPPAVVTTAENFATPFIVNFAQAHAWLATVIAVLGTLRLVAKPLTSAVEVYVKNSPSKSDDSLLENAEHSWPWKVFFWLLDYGTSIKAGSQFTATPKS